MRIQRGAAFCCGLLLAVMVGQGSIGSALANTEVERLQAQIEERNDRLSAIEAEIEQYESALMEVGRRKILSRTKSINFA
jgi:hypothetical protein